MYRPCSQNLLYDNGVMAGCTGACSRPLLLSRPNIEGSLANHHTTIFPHIIAIFPALPITWSIYLCTQTPLPIGVFSTELFAPLFS